MRKDAEVSASFFISLHYYFNTIAKYLLLHTNVKSSMATKMAMIIK